MSSVIACRPGTRAAGPERGARGRRLAAPHASAAASHPQQQRDGPADRAAACSRRAALGLAAVLGGATALRPALAAEELDAGAPGAAPAPVSEFVSFASEAQGYSLSRPASWEQVSKAGADVLFRDPERKSTSVGVTVFPVTISSLAQFGDLDAVGRRLLDAERAKESTLGVEILSQAQRAEGGTTLYDYVYRLDSTRGTKQIINSVAVASRKLYILNGSLSCGKGEDSSCSAADVELLQRVAASFRVAG